MIHDKYDNHFAQLLILLTKKIKIMMIRHLFGRIAAKN